MFTFIAGATTTGAVQARYNVVRKSSATPRANFAMMSAVAGATRRRSVRCATAMCSMALSRLASPPEESLKRSVMTFCPLKAANVSGVTNSRALRVITTCTLSPSCCSRRTSSAALYAATPPVTPSVIRILASRWALLLPLVAVLIFVDGSRLGEIEFEQALVEFFTGDSSSLLGPGVLDHRRRSGHNLARAPGRKHHIRKLALRSFALHGHFNFSPQTMPEVFAPGPVSARWRSAKRLQSPAPRGLRAPHLHSPRKNHNTCQRLRFHPAPWQAAAQSPHRNPARGCAAGAPALPAMEEE